MKPPKVGRYIPDHHKYTLNYRSNVMIPQKQKVRNFVAKNAPSTGAGEHKTKNGVHASRERQKREWKKEIIQ